MTNKKCRHCESGIPVAALVCPVCRQNLEDGVPPDLTRLPKCPVCKIPVYPAHLSVHSVYHCEECEGTAVSKETLMKIQPNENKNIERSQLGRNHLKPPYFEPRDKPPFLICPFCLKKMNETRLGNMKIDICEKCSALWFERGREKHIQDILGPYKMKMLNKGSGGGSSRRSRR